MATETELKLQDAETQWRLALNNNDNEEVVRSCINSVISSGRSMTFVMQTESSGNPELKAWYDAKMAALLASPTTGPLLKFFNDRRVHTIHRGVVPTPRVTARITEMHLNGVQVPTSPASTMSFYRFDGVHDYLPGRSGNVFRMCQQYLDVMRAMVTEWLVEHARVT